MHCKVCGAPGYVSPCYSCRGKGHTTDPVPQPPPVAHGPRHPQPLWPPMAAVEVPAERAGTLRSLLDHGRYRTAHQALHRLWTKHTGHPSYVKEEWHELEAALDDLARNGLGAPDSTPFVSPEAKTPPVAVVSPNGTAE